jgi:hypothetical protein
MVANLAIIGGAIVITGLMLRVREVLLQFEVRKRRKRMKSSSRN